VDWKFTFHATSSAILADTIVLFVDVLIRVSGGPSFDTDSMELDQNSVNHQGCH
jgi:hypothetical protein